MGNCVSAEEAQEYVFKAATVGDVPLLLQMLKEHSVEINAYNAQGQTPLHLAVQALQYDFCRVLIEYGASLVQRNAGTILISFSVSRLACHRGTSSDTSCNPNGFPAIVKALARR